MGKKISELEARTAVTNNDIFVIVDEPGTGSAETAKITYSTLRDSIIAEAGFNTVGNDQILDPASAGGNVTINASATVNGDFTVSGNTIIDAGSQIVSNPDNPITINPGGTGDTIIESELITNGPLTANNNLSVNGDFSVTGNVDGIGLLDLDMANTSKIADGTAGFLLQTDGAGNFKFVQGASTKGTFTDGAGVVYDDQQYNILGITQANPGVMTVASGHNLVTGDSITVTGVNGMTEVNNQTYFVSVSGDELTLYSDSAMTTQVNTTGFTAYIDSGSADAGDGAFVPGTSSSSIGDLSDVDITTSAPSSGDALKWDGTNFVPVASAEIDPDMTPTDGQALVWDDQQYAISGATQANPVVVTLPTDHNLSNGDAITITNVGGMTELNDQTVYVSVGTNGEVSLYTDAGLTSPLDGTGYSAYTSGGNASAGTGNWVANVAATAVDTLTDVDTTGLADGQILKYNSSNTTWTPMSTGELLLSDASVPTIKWRDTTISNASLQDGDFIVWDSQTYNINNIIKSAQTLADIPGHNFSNGDFITISGVEGMTEINGQQVYVQPMTQNGVGFFTDAAMTTYYNSSGHSNYTAPSGVATGAGTWRIHRGQSMDGSSGTTADFEGLNLNVEQLNVFKAGGAKADPDDFADEDLIKWDNFEYAIDSVIKNGTGPTQMRFQEPHYMTDGTRITPSNVAGGMGTTINGNNYYVKSINTTAVELYTDADLTTGLNTAASASYIQAENDVISSPSGCWKVSSDLGSINNLSDVSISDLNALRPFLKYNAGTQLFENVSGAELNASPYQYLELGNITIDPDTIQEGQTIEWRDHTWDIVDISESSNQLYVDMGLEAWEDDGLGTIAWVVFDMSGAVGATEIGYQAGVWHQIMRVDQSGTYPPSNTHYSVTAGNIHSTDTLTQYLGSNTSAWTSGGKVKMVTLDGANSAGSFIAVDQGGSSTSNTGGVPITSPEGGLDAGDVLTWSDGTVGRGQIGGITNTGTQPTYVTSSELGHEVEFSRPGTPVVMPSPDPADYWTPGSTLAQIDADGYDRVVGRFLDLHDAGGADSALNGVYLELTTASSTVANSDPEGTGKRRYHMIKLDQTTRARLTHANGEYQVYEAPSGSPDINGTTIHDADARFERVDPATGLALGSWVAISSSGGTGAAVLNISDTPPSNPSDGTLWWESDTGRLKLYYNDGSSAQWVDAFTTSTAADKNIFNSTTQEKTNVVASAGSGGKDYDCSSAGIHHLSNIAGDIDANLTNLSLDVGYSTTVTFVLNQSSNAKVVKTLSIGGSSQTVNWVGGVVPTGTASGVDAMSFSIIRTGASAYTVLGQLVPFS